MEKIKVLISSNYSSKNAYVSTIVNGLKSKCNVECSIEAFWNSSEKFNIVHIQWPEELFYWSPITVNDLNRLKDKLNSWKERGSHIVVTRHNELPHRRQSLDSALYELVYGSADGVIHLGEFSKKNLSSSNNINVVINHPSYEQDNILESSDSSRMSLSLPLGGTMFLSLGQIRNQEEVTFLLNAFLNFKKKNKNVFLVICNYLNPSRSISLRKNPFKRVWNELLFVVSKRLLRAKDIFIKTDNIESNKVSKYMNSSDIVVVPRLNSLNSGVVFLGFTYGKPVVGPNVGNMEEILVENGNPVFTPGKIEEFVEALRLARENAKTLGENNRSYVTKFCNSETVAAQHCKFYENVIKNY